MSGSQCAVSPEPSGGDAAYLRRGFVHANWRRALEGESHEPTLVVTDRVGADCDIGKAQLNCGERFCEVPLLQPRDDFAPFIRCPREFPCHALEDVLQQLGNSGKDEDAVDLETEDSGLNADEEPGAPRESRHQEFRLGESRPVTPPDAILGLRMRFEREIQGVRHRRSGAIVVRRSDSAGHQHAVPGVQGVPDGGDDDGVLVGNDPDTAHPRTQRGKPPGQKVDIAILDIAAQDFVSDDDQPYTAHAGFSGAPGEADGSGEGALTPRTARHYSATASQTHPQWSDMALTEVSLSLEQGFSCQLFTKSHIVVADDPSDPELEEEGPSPLEFLLAAIASSAAISVKTRAAELGIELEEVQVSVRWRSTHRTLLEGGALPDGAVQREMRVRIGRDITEIERDALLAAAKASPVDRSLGGGLRIEDALYVFGYAS